MSTGGRPAAEELSEVLAAIGPTDGALLAEAAAFHARLTKPAGSLGRLEQLGAQLSAIAGRVPPPYPEPAAVAVFAADHGVVDEAVTPWPQEVTTQMVTNFCAGGAAINVLARRMGASVTVVDVGLSYDAPSHPRLLERKVRRGTANLLREPAMDAGEALVAVGVGVEVARSLVAAGAGCLVTGDMGIGNTTASAAVIAALTGRPAADVTGRGTGIDDAMLAHKTQVVTEALRRARHIERRDGPAEAIAVLSEVGGLEIAALTGFCLAGAAARVPVVVDGVIALAAACAAHRLAPAVVDYLIAGHRPVEPGGQAALLHLGLAPIIDLELRLGEGSGAALAVPVVQAAAAVMCEMATFDAAGVHDKREATDEPSR